MTDYLAVICDFDGRILESLHLRPDVPSVTPGDDLRTIVNLGSRDKLGAFLEAVRREGHAVGWELSIPTSGQITPFQVAGVALRDRLLILANASHQGLVRLVEELGRINSEQASELRRALKELSVRRAHLPDPDVLTEMSRLNNDLATAQRELAGRSARLEQLLREKNELVGMAAHDLRNPLAVIHGVAEHLVQDAGDRLDLDQVEMLEHIRASSEHMLVLVEELLDLASLESGTLTLTRRPTDLVDLVDRTLRLCRELARPKEIAIGLRVAPGVAPALAAADVDANKLSQALVNLVTNAIKFSHRGAAIEVRLGLDDGEITLEVEDSGVGISEAQLSHLFTPFRPGRRGTRGEKTSGLGLAIVRRIVRGHGGDVRVASRVQEGTTVTITLPLQVSPAAAAGSAQPDAPGRALDVLVADDDPFSAEIVARLLEALGHRPEAVTDVDAAIAAVRARRFDIALLDLQMPGGGGQAIADALRERERGLGRRTPIVALTGLGGERAAARAREGGFDGVLGKPTEPRELQRLFARLAP